MKPSLLLPLLAVSCQTARQVTLPNGASYSDNGHFAGDTTVLMEPDGSVILRNKMNKPWADFLQAVAAIFIGEQVADVAISQIAKTKAVSLASQRTAALKAQSAADLEKLRISTDLEKFRLLHPEPLPAAGPP